MLTTTAGAQFWQPCRQVEEAGRAGVCVSQLLSSQRCSAQRMLLSDGGPCLSCPAVGVWQCTVAEPQVQAICCSLNTTAESGRPRQGLLFDSRAQGSFWLACWVIASTFTSGVVLAGVQPCSARQSAQAPSSVPSGVGAARGLAGGSVLNSNLRIWQDSRHSRQLGGLGVSGRVLFLPVASARDCSTRGTRGCCSFLLPASGNAQPGYLW